MYLEFYGLRDLPFERTSNPRFLFMTAGHREALSILQHGVHARKSITLLVGDAGTGKTTLIRTLLKGMESTGACVVFINDPRLTRNELVEMVAIGFGLSSAANMSKATMLFEIEQVLQARAAAGRMTALVVDEAQSLSDDLLEEIRLLANIESDSTTLLPVVLAGQPQLADRLNRPGLRQSKQPVSLRCDLQPLTLTDTAGYVLWRVRAAGGDVATIFFRDAVEAIHEISGGIAGMINALCDSSLRAAFAADCRPVTRAIVVEVSADLGFRAVAVTPALPSLTSTAFEPRPIRTARGHAVDGAADWQDLTPPYESFDDLDVLRSERDEGEARPQPAAQAVTRPASLDDVWSRNPGRALSGAPTPLNAGRMFEALDRALAQGPLASPRRVVPPRRETTE